MSGGKCHLQSLVLHVLPFFFTQAYVLQPILLLLRDLLFPEHLPALHANDAQ
jgi:hypothetical protein